MRVLLVYHIWYLLPIPVLVLYRTRFATNGNYAHIHEMER